jgi:hypothetical protein
LPRESLEVQGVEVESKLEARVRRGMDSLFYTRRPRAKYVQARGGNVWWFLT